MTNSTANAPVNTARRGPWRRRWSMTQDAILVVYAAFFLYIYVSDVADGKLTSIPFVAEQLLLVGMFLLRRRSLATSTRAFDWFVAIGGWLPLALRPGGAAGPGLETVGVTIQTMGLLLTCVGFLYLGRSFGIVAANRGMKTAGPYALIRHPIYFSHTVTMCGFLIANPTVYNLSLFAVISLCQLLRIQAEERVLTETGEYADYRQRVRWRLVPGLY